MKSPWHNDTPEGFAYVWALNAPPVCFLCGVDTFKAGEFYMVDDDVWEEAVAPAEDLGFLCIGCLEQRLGRRLRPEDFSPLPINEPNPRHSKRLSDRLGHRLA